jgi:hypothetical protein
MAKKDWNIDSLFETPAPKVKQPAAQEEKPIITEPVAQEQQPVIEQKPKKPVKQISKETRKEENKETGKQYNYGKKCTFEIPEELLEDFQALAFIRKKKVRTLLIETLQEVVDENKEAIKLIKSVK